VLYRKRPRLERAFTANPTIWLPLNTPELEEDDQALVWCYRWGDYVALSCAWGARTPKHMIILNDCPFEVNENLYYVLLELRNSTRVQQGFKIWIDAICINQADENERSQQVTLMRQSYSSVWHVVVWLRHRENNSNLATAAMQWMAARLRSTDYTHGLYGSGSEEPFKLSLPVTKWFMTIGASPPWKTEVFKALYDLFLRPYWHRLWILQEIVMAREDAPVLCGNRCLLW
jgi:Heterokaryon incompatibility protein (HET)